MTQGYQVPNKPWLPTAFPARGFEKDSEQTLLRKRFYCIGTLHRCNIPWCHYESTEYFNVCPQCHSHFSSRRAKCTHQQKDKGWMWCPKCGGYATCRYGGPYTMEEQAWILNKYWDVKV